MSISVQSLMDEMASKFGVSASSERFVSKFLIAVNNVSADLSSFEINQDDIDSIEDDISLDGQYKRAYQAGLAYYLQQNKEWGIEPDVEAFARYRRALGECQALNFIDNPPYTRADE